METAELVGFVFGDIPFKAEETERDVLVELGRALGQHMRRMAAAVKQEPTDDTNCAAVVDAADAAETVPAPAASSGNDDWQIKELGEQTIRVNDLLYTQTSASEAFSDQSFGKIERLLTDLNDGLVDLLQEPRLRWRGIHHDLTA